MKKLTAPHSSHKGPQKNSFGSRFALSARFRVFLRYHMPRLLVLLFLRPIPTVGLSDMFRLSIKD
jgi:hypothetical protein